jgi:UDP:flavonoid glycosyltransferase YjiC (YdhE family)
MPQLVELPPADEGLGPHRHSGRLLTKNLTTSRLRDKVIQAMTMSAGARRVAAGYAATGGAAHGASLIEQRLPTSKQLTTSGRA